MDIEIRMPKLGLTMEAGTVVQWYKSEGDTVRQGEPVVEISTEKVNADVEAPAAGVLQRLYAEVGDDVSVGETLAILSSAMATAEEDTPASVSDVSTAPRSATPLAARIAAEHGIDLTEVPASGLQRRITREDVEEYLSTTVTAQSDVAQPRLATPIVKRLAREQNIDWRQIAGSGPDGLVIERDLRAYVTGRSDIEESDTDFPPIRERLALVGRRKVIAERMQQSAQTIPHIHLSADINMSAADEIRKGASYTALVTWVTARTLTNHPLLNSWFYDDEILVFDAINIGVAVDTDEGLIVPVIRNAQELSLNEIHEAIQRLSERARRGELTLEEVSAGTITISNLGMLGVDRFDAIINPPQAAILAVGRTRLQSIALSPNTVSICPIMTLTISADHRIVDGAAVARFLQDFRKNIRPNSIGTSVTVID